MDWLDTHAREREILFTAPGIKRGSNALTKMECSRRAADAIFSHSADMNDPRRVDGGLRPSSSTRMVYDYIRRL